MLRTYLVTAAGTGTASASCLTGDVAIGGGYTDTAVGGDIDTSMPTGGSATTPPTGWQVSAATATDPVSVYVICHDEP